MSPSYHLAFLLTLCSVTYALPVLQTRSNTHYSKPSFDTPSAIALAVFLSLSALVALGYAAIVQIRKRRRAPSPVFSTKKAMIKVTKEQISKPFAPVDLVSSIIPDKDGGPGFGFEGLSESVLQSLREQESREDTNERGGKEDDASVEFVKLPDIPPMLSMGSLKSNSSFRIVLYQEKDSG